MPLPPADRDLPREPWPREELAAWLAETRPGPLARLRARADQVRRESVGDEVHLRGLIELSNHCVRECHYCGLRCGHDELERYRLTEAQVLEAARRAARLGCGTVVLQSGEDPGLGAGFVADLVARIKDELGLAVTLGLGERRPEELARWREAGADRYLLKFETSDGTLYRRLHGGGSAGPDRRERLRLLRELGYEIGSGVMVGLPGQTWEILADDLRLFRELDLDMIGVGPFLPHPRTPLGERGGSRAALSRQVAADEETTLTVVALSRLMCREANIPSTTALATLDRRSGRELGLRSGANVFMPNVTPEPYRKQYEIYPGKAQAREGATLSRAEIEVSLARIGRRLGRGRGDRHR